MIVTPRLFEAPYTVRASDLDCYRRLRIDSVLDFFQDAAGRHSQSMGIGFEDMLGRDLLWMISKIHFRVVAPVVMYQPVTVRTWPHPPGAVTCRRDCQILSEQGDVLVEGTSEWLVIRRQDRKIMPTRDIYPFADDFYPHDVMPGRMEKLRAFTPAGPGVTVTPGFADLDMNGHVNNTKYAAFVLNALAPEEHRRLQTFAIQYHREVLAGQPLTLFTQTTPAGAEAMGQNGAGEVMFTCRLTTGPAL